MMGVFVQLNEGSKHGRRHPIGYVIQENGCWDFTGTPNSDGYGAIKRAGVTISAHRVVYASRVGVIPDDLELDHLCRNRRCVNPDHLEPVTHKENMQRGRFSRSEKTHCPAGHAYDDGNTYRSGRRRHCRPCRASATRKYRERLAGSAG